MNDEQKPLESLNPYNCKVIRFVDGDGKISEEKIQSGQFSLLISLGIEDGVEVGDRLVVFSLGEEILDPDTGETLGMFEIVRGEGKVTSVQKRMAVVKSERKVSAQRPKNQNALLAISGATIEYETYFRSAPFVDPNIGDLVRFI